MFRRPLLSSAAAAMLVLAARAVQAQVETPDTGEGLVGSPDAFAIGSNLLGVTVNLLLVLAAIVVLAWVFRRVQGIGQPAAGSLRVAATLPLGPKERILLLQVGEEQLVVGASPGGLQTLHVLTQPLALGANDAPAAGEQTFRARLSAALTKAQS